MLKELVHKLYLEEINMEGKKEGRKGGRKEGREGRKERSKSNLASSQKH